MHIEHRTSIRKRVALNVLINYDLAYSKPWKVCDLSLNGVLVEADQAGLPLGVPVEAVFALEGRRAHDRYRVPAEVVRVDQNRMALKFRDYDSRAYTALVNFLYAG